MIKITWQQAGIVVDVHVAIVINQRSEVQTKQREKQSKTKTKGVSYTDLNKLTYLELEAE